VHEPHAAADPQGVSAVVKHPVLEAIRGRTIDAYGCAVAGLLLLACWSSYGAPTIAAMQAGQRSLWTFQILPGASVVLLSLAVVIGVWCLSTLDGPVEASTLDAVVAWLLGGIAFLHLLAVARHAPGLLFELLDIRALVLLAAGYFVMSRLNLPTRALLMLLGGVAVALAIHAAWLTLRYGILGDTGFATSSGRIALLVTEDALLLAIPVTIAWGLLADGLLKRRLVIAVVAFVGAVAYVELLSLRRGALIFIGALVLMRSLWAPASRVIAWGSLVLVVLTLALTVGPLASVAGDVSYAVRSSLLLTSDASSSQRRGEIEDYQMNLDGAGDLLLGRGLGAVWYASADAPTDAVSYGGKETALVRIGWHVYGLDWLYKIGLIGVLGVVAVLALGALTVRERLATVDDQLVRSVAWSFALTAPVLTLFVFTNPRLSLFAGLCFGAVSALLDRSPRRSA